MPDPDEFFDRLRTLNNMAGRISTSGEEVLQEYIESIEAFTLADGTPTVTTRAASAAQYTWNATPAAAVILWGEWAWKT